MNENQPKSEIILYQTEDGVTRVEVRLQDETVWLTVAQMAELFQRDRTSVFKHIQNIFDEGELSPERTVANFATVQTEGGREVSRDVDHFNLDVIISDRLGEFFVNPQRFMDAIAAILKHELHRLLIDGIKYERIPGSGSEAEWKMMKFEEKELINYLTALQVDKSVYEYIVYDSEIEREFARRLNERIDIKLFVKLPN